MSVEFLQDKDMDAMINDIVAIFKMEDVQLVRLKGLTKRESLISNRNMSEDVIHNILLKLKRNDIINFKCVYTCPHCGETFFQIVDIDSNKKICDSCKIVFELVNNKNLFIEF